MRSRTESAYLRAYIDMMICRMVILLIAILAFGVHQAWSQEAPGQVNMRPLVDTIMPYAIELFLALMFALASVVAAWLKSKWNIDMEATLREIEARHKDALHSAIKSAVSAAIARGVDPLTFNVGSEGLAKVIRYARDSVPDAMEHLDPPEQVIASIVKAKALEVAPPPKAVITVDAGQAKGV